MRAAKAEAVRELDLLCTTRQTEGSFLEGRWMMFMAELNSFRHNAAFVRDTEETHRNVLQGAQSIGMDVRRLPPALVPARVDELFAELRHEFLIKYDTFYPRFESKMTGATEQARAEGIEYASAFNWFGIQQQSGTLSDGGRTYARFKLICDAMNALKAEFEAADLAAAAAAPSSTAATSTAAANNIE